MSLDDQMKAASGDLFRTKVPVTNQLHRDLLMRCSGARAIVEALRDAKSNLPGMVMAIAIAEAEAAKAQIDLSGKTYREAAKAGVDLTAVSAIYTTYGEDGRTLEMTIETEAPAE